MGLYAEAVLAQGRAKGEPPLPPGEGWVVLGAESIEPSRLRSLFPTPPRLLVLDANPRCEGGAGSDGVRTAAVAKGPPPHLPPATREALVGRYRAAVLLNGLGAASGRLVRDLARCGIKSVAYRVSDGDLADDEPLAGTTPGRWTPWRAREDGGWGSWRVASARGLAARKAAERLSATLRQCVPQALRRRLLAGEPAHAEAWRELAGCASASTREPSTPNHVALYIGGLIAGGAERQLCNLAVALRDRGVRVTVLTSRPLAGDEGHYGSLLAGAQVEVRTAGAEAEPRARAALITSARPELVASVPADIRTEVLDLAGELLRDPPDVLHGWLDQPNIIAGAAGILAGVPRIGLSLRNLRPACFPDFFKPWMEPWYRLLHSLPQVSLSANSVAGANDYATWLGTSKRGFVVLRNGLNPLPLSHDGGSGSPTASPSQSQSERRDELRRGLGIAAGCPLVLGVFRLAPEKAPLDFLDVVDAVRRSVPDLVAVVAGDGPLRGVVEQAVRQRGLASCVRLLGVRTDVPALMAAADCLLLTSLHEGTPNAALEAQSLGLPVVATDVGGTAEAIANGETGHLFRARDVEGLAGGVMRVLADPLHRGLLSRAGPGWVAARFSMDAATTSTLAWYRDIARIPSQPPAHSTEPAGGVR